MDSFRARQHNQHAWDRLARNEHRFAKPANEQDLRSPLETVDARGWLGESIQGWQVLCLAAGGGKQSALYASAGARVTVVDLSREMLRLDERVSQQQGLPIETVHTSMDDLTMLQTAAFDLVIHPVSTCYLPNLADVYREVARVTRAGGLYISQHKQPTSLQCSLVTNSTGNYELQQPYYRRDRLPGAADSPLREEGTWEFIHRWESLLGWMCRAGFVIEDVAEPMHAKEDAARDDFAHRALFVAPYVRVKARRASDSVAAKRVDLWVPETEE